MLAVAGLLALSNSAWAIGLPDRSSLSFDENATINIACASVLSQGNDAFQTCVAKQIASLREHPTPDRSALSPSRARVVETSCAFTKRNGIAAYNDCVKQAIAEPRKSVEDSTDDELTPNYAKAFTDADADRPQMTPIAAMTLPKPAAALPQRPDRIAENVLSPADLFKRVERSVFVVLATQSLAEVRTRNIVQGSAIAISEHLLLTNCHVVKDRPLIKLVQEGVRAQATLVAADNATDRCVIKTEALTLAPIGGVRTLDSLAVGERVFAIGAPLSMERTLSEGLISGIRHETGRNLVQTSAPLGHGSSGGGLFDDRGNLIGITTLASFGGAQNLNFAIAAADYWR
jgi:hypothetical protein